MRLDITVLAALTTLAGACGEVTASAEPSEVEAVEVVAVEVEAVEVEAVEVEAVEVEAVEVEAVEVEAPMVHLDPDAEPVETVHSLDLDDCPACGRG